MIVFTLVVGVSWEQALEVHEVASFVCASNAFDLDAASNFDFFIFAIDDFIYLNVHLFAYFLHQIMKLLSSMYSLTFVNCTIFGKSRKISVVQYAWYYTLADYTMASVVYNGGRQVAQAFNFEVLEGSQATQIVVCLAPAWVVLEAGKVPEVVHLVKSEAEEDVVVYEHLGILVLIRIQCGQTSFDNGNSTLSCSCKKIIVDLLQSSIPLASLSHITFGEILDHLILFVPVSHATWVQTVQWGYHLAHCMLITCLSFLIIFAECTPVVHFQLRFC